MGNKRTPTNDELWALKNTEGELDKIEKGGNPERFEFPELDEAETTREVCGVKG